MQLLMHIRLCESDFNEHTVDEVQELTPQYGSDALQSQAHLLSLSAVMNIHI